LAGDARKRSEFHRVSARPRERGAGAASTSMPNYAAQSLSDASAKDIYAYIRTFKSNAPPADQIAVFKQILGSAQNNGSAATPK
jgi:hypothetical protein